MQTRDEDEIFSANISNCMYEKEKCNFCVDTEILRPSKTHATRILLPVKTHAAKILRPVKIHATEILRPVKIHAAEIVQPVKTHAAEILRPVKTHATEILRHVKTRRVEFQVHWGQQKISRPSRGKCFAVFSRDTSEWSIHEVKTIKRSKSIGNKFEK